MPEYFDHKIKHQVFIKASPEKVYDTITSGDGWNAFFTRETEVDPRPDGKIVFRWRNWGPGDYNSNADGKVLNADRPNLFTFQWYPVGKETPTTVEFSISSKFGGSVIELTESGYPNTSQGRDMILECASGWGEALTLLKFYLEFGAVYTPPARDA
jgi:uncharacterized protein YndB with AHSA1/START domain